MTAGGARADYPRESRSDALVAPPGFSAFIPACRAFLPVGLEATAVARAPGRQMMGPGVTIDATDPAYDAARRALAFAWGTESVTIGGGGSIPFVTAFAAAFPNASLLLTGVADPDSRLHSDNESVDLKELERACVAEVLLLCLLSGVES